MPTIELKPQPEFLVLLDRLVEALERNNELLNIANNRALGSRTRDELPPAPASARKPQYVRKSERKYDYGKIYALYEAGWRYQDIADEAGWRYQDIADEVGCSHSLVGRVLIDKYGTSKKFSRKKGATQSCES